MAVAGGGLLAAGQAVGRRLRTRLGRGGDPRWSAVTVLRSPAEVTGSAALAPLQALGNAVETTVGEAPGGRGSELRARWAAGQAHRAPDELRAALREAKQVLEVGEVLRSVPRPEGSRPPTPGGALIDLAERRSGGKGVL